MVFPDLSYNEACLKANLPKLSKRRDTLSQNLFANIVRNKDHNYNCYKSYLPIINLWSFVVTCAHLWLSVDVRSHSWSFVVTRGHSWSFVVTRGHSWSFVVTRGHSCVLLDKITCVGT